ncbi:MAG: phosphate-starvation-inducible PsiE family protein [Candidatus Nitrotoga sp.]
MDINSDKQVASGPPFKKFNLKMLTWVENIFLLIIAIATVYAMATEVRVMIVAEKATLADLLLLFIYLEILAMVGQYYSVGKLSVRFPLYIAMVALARYIIMDVKSMEDWRMLAVSGSILLLTMAVFLVRYGHVRYPYPFSGDDAVMDVRRDRVQQN